MKTGPDLGMRRSLYPDDLAFFRAAALTIVVEVAFAAVLVVGLLLTM